MKDIKTKKHKIQKDIKDLFAGEACEILALGFFGVLK